MNIKLKNSKFYDCIKNLKIIIEIIEKKNSILYIISPLVFIADDAAWIAVLPLSRPAEALTSAPDFRSNFTRDMLSISAAAWIGDLPSFPWWRLFTSSPSLSRNSTSTSSPMQIADWRIDAPVCLFLGPLTSAPAASRIWAISSRRSDLSIVLTAVGTGHI